MAKRDLKSLIDLIPNIQEEDLGSRPSWNEGFMCDAIRASTRSSCLNVHSGSVIVYNKRIIATGYNGAPRNKTSCHDLGVCYKEHVTGKNYEETMNIGVCQGVHSEKNALFNISKEVPEHSSTLYTTIFPCNTCAKDLSGSGLIKEVVFKKLYDLKEFESAMRMFNEVGISIKRLDLSPERYIDIIFNQRSAKFDAWTEKERKRALLRDIS